jgi:hypothetical protein
MAKHIEDERDALKARITKLESQGVAEYWYSLCKALDLSSPMGRNR